jgi:hypothetical protein
MHLHLISEFAMPSQEAIIIGLHLLQVTRGAVCRTRCRISRALAMRRQQG